MALGSAAIAVVVAAVAFAPVLATSHHDRRTAAPAPSGAHAQPGVLVSKLVRDTHPTVPPSVVDALTSANTSTAIDLYHQLAAKPGNVFFSPYSIKTALGMAAAGARGEHARADARACSTTRSRPPSSTTPPTRSTSRSSRRGRHPPVARASHSSSSWPTRCGVRPGSTSSPASSICSRDYGAALNTLDFQSHAAEATKAINAWVAANTNNKIRDLFASLDPTTRLVLVNAVHFKASWQQPFLPAKTHDGQFTTATGSTVTVPFMHGLVRRRRTRRAPGGRRSTCPTSATRR